MDSKITLLLPKNASSIVALVDGDIIRYSAGFAAEGEPVENCLHTVKKMLLSIKEDTNTNEVRVFLTGKGNFRVDLATIKPYKGNRKDRKPEHFDAITEYLLKYWGAEVIDGMEADDALAIEHLKEPDASIICTIDKDLYQVPGFHYNWRKGEKYLIEEEDANYNLYMQILTGDSVDNIPGCKGIGPKKAAKILDGVENPSDMYELAKQTYLSVYGDKEVAYKHLIETAHLVYILRSEDDEWRKPELDPAETTKGH